MPKEKSNQKTKRRKWTFSLEQISAKEVFLMGDFQQLENSEKHPYGRDENGMWNKVVMLAPRRL